MQRTTPSRRTGRDAIVALARAWRKQQDDGAKHALISAIDEYESKLQDTTTPNDLRIRRRFDWISQNGPCRICGSFEDLEVDHIDYATKAFKVSDIWTRNIALRTAELQKCQVLCRTCHMLKTSAESKVRRKGRRYVVPQELTNFAEIYELTCVNCNKSFERRATVERAKVKGRTYGPYCGTTCRNAAMSEVKSSLRRQDEHWLTTTAEIVRLGLELVPIKNIMTKLKVGRNRIGRVYAEYGISSKKVKRELKLPHTTT